MQSPRPFLRARAPSASSGARTCSGATTRRAHQHCDRNGRSTRRGPATRVRVACTIIGTGPVSNWRGIKKPKAFTTKAQRAQSGPRRAARHPITHPYRHSVVFLRVLCAFVVGSLPAFGHGRSSNWTTSPSSQIPPAHSLVNSLGSGVQLASRVNPPPARDAPRNNRRVGPVHHVAGESVRRPATNLTSTLLLGLRAFPVRGSNARGSAAFRPRSAQSIPLCWSRGPTMVRGFII